jgi:alkylation response protein AidB-like acyl-CoA dehydrogenase
MDFNFTAEQEMLRESVIRFVRGECPEELFRKMDEEAYYPQELYAKLAGLGFFGITFPEEFGGSGMGCVSAAIFQEELSKRLLPLQMTYQLSILSAGMTILELGTPAQKGKFLRPLVEGKINFAIAFTEPGAGSDAASISLAAVPGNGGFRLNGQKIFISAADISDYMIVSTRTDRKAPKRKGITAFIVESKSPGLAIRKISKLGVKASAYCEVFFDDVHVPSENILNGLDQGWAVVTHSLELDRIGAAARWVGISQEALDYAMNYARNRSQFGRKVSSFEWARDLFAEMQTQIDAARLLTYRAAHLMDQGKPCRKEASMAKLFASELVVRLTRDMMQVLGGYSYAMEYHAQRYLRDCLFATIGAGTSQIQKLIIANEMGL